MTEKQQVTELAARFIESMLRGKGLELWTDSPRVIHTAFSMAQALVESANMAYPEEVADNVDTDRPKMKPFEKGDILSQNDTGEIYVVASADKTTVTIGKDGAFVKLEMVDAMANFNLYKRPSNVKTPGVSNEGSDIATGSMIRDIQKEEQPKEERIQTKQEMGVIKAIALWGDHRVTHTAKIKESVTDEDIMLARDFFAMIESEIHVFRNSMPIQPENL